MSLIADALKKAQSAKLGRRYLSVDPAGVLPKARESGQGIFGSALGRLNLSPTLLMGLGSGVLLFLVLVVYFFFGRGPKSPTAVSPEAMERQAELILVPPPMVVGVEPLALAPTETAAEQSKMEEIDGKTPSGEKTPYQQKIDSQVRKMKKATVPAAASKKEEKKESVKIAAAPDLSEEVRRYFNLAFFYQEEKKFSLARRAYEKVLELWPLYVEAHNNLGMVYKELGMYEEAVAELKKALALNPRYPTAYHNLGVLYQTIGDREQAVSNYEKALSLDRHRPSSYNNLGLVYRFQERPHKAREVFEKALAINPGFPEIHYNLALVLEELGERGLARIHYQKFIDLAGEKDRDLVEKVRLHLQGLLAKN